MSEYQYYEFRAVDQTLTDQQLRELRAISTRAHITTTSFTNEYHWGDFKGDPRKMMFQYFEAFLYFANWGTRRLMFRLPADLVDVKAIKQYCTSEAFSLEVKGGHAVVEFYFGDDGGGEDWDTEFDWEWDRNDDEEGFGAGGALEPFLPVREALIEGDLRALYLGWLASVREHEVDDNAPEPPVPPGMKELPAPLRTLAEFLRVDSDLLDAAAEASAPAPGSSAPGRKELADRIAGLPETERNVLLLDLASGEVARARRTLMKRLRDEAPKSDASTRATGPRRTAGQLLAAAEARAEERRQKDAARRAKERAKREAAAAAAREKYIDDLTGRQEETWEHVEALIVSKLPKHYDEAVKLLADLRDVSMRDKTLRSFETRVRALTDRHAKKPTLIERLRKAKMLTWGGAA